MEIVFNKIQSDAELWVRVAGGALQLAALSNAPSTWVPITSAIEAAAPSKAEGYFNPFPNFARHLHWPLHQTRTSSDKLAA
jgi:hypothetical protein